MSESSSSRGPSGLRRDQEDEVSWLDFLRTAGGTAPLEPSNSSDRKRRHTGTEPQRREYAYPTHPASMSNTAGWRPSGPNTTRYTGATAETAIDLTTPPRTRPAMPKISSGVEEGSTRARLGSDSRRRGSRESDAVVPKWQPDTEVSRCPVCKTEFSFWYRKHHCRKCGRVVCNACSPHRITIPRQYIVQPPNALETEFGIPEPENPVARGLGGGEVVRVCNPCVPDPWTPSTAARGGDGADVPPRQLIDGARNAGEPPARQRSERYRYIPPPQSGRSRAQSYQPVPPPFSRSAPRSHPNASVVFRDHSGDGIPPVPTSSRPSSHSHRYTQSSSSRLPPIPSTSRDRGDRPSLSTAPSAPPQPKPRREVREEDECPVCGTELPPGEQVREAHIQECIAERFSSGTTPSMRPPAPITNSANNPLDPAVASASSASTPHIQANTRPRATSYRPRGMALYRATEKDCTNAAGEPQECVICFEDFEPGDELGRMECLCKFHKQCIRSWWERKGGGSCPTHQLQE